MYFKQHLIHKVSYNMNKEDMESTVSTVIGQATI